VALVTTDPEHRQVLLEQAQIILRAADSTVPELHDRERINEVLNTVTETLDEDKALRPLNVPLRIYS
jgi:uncharacterized membrane protein